ncbi:hypothetical protein I6F14_08950 [Bradyrhizobium sp. IC3069]|uniref:hypothetical protein n=1 Tax=unclassified Bradyrhizobium TaxID=2631580 RepID=UPI001CD77D49|nr:MULTISPECIES: hypothetical protein [unclassified Bradyrhizobium]MCA1361040.1 hypothetical protein [Bradyrhizobium sp. IC4059]MCA1378958.1 hypothetical protein [Bradyrhizobium sp. IC4060]MCA1488528.1 hypothetical protein [Bradyrhizobium sp. IC4061]MCA1518158.1 hypothetical protein [Bradyrhizobium sp. IC3069]
MFAFTLEWTRVRSPAERATDARAVTDRIGWHEALILPLVLLIAFLFVLGLMTRLHLHERADRSLMYASFGSMGLPMLPTVPDSCRRPLNAGSTQQLRHADVLALLAND